MNVFQPHTSPAVGAAVGSCAFLLLAFAAWVPEIRRTMELGRTQESFPPLYVVVAPAGRSQTFSEMLTFTVYYVIKHLHLQRRCLHMYEHMHAFYNEGKQNKANIPLHLRFHHIISCFLYCKTPVMDFSSISALVLAVWGKR